MERREFMMASLAGGYSSFSPGSVLADTANQYVTLRWFRCRRDHDLDRMRAFLRDAAIPAFGRLGVKPVGVFQVTVGPDNPSFLVVAPYASMSGIQDSMTRLGADEKWRKDHGAFEEKWDLAYDYMECSLLSCFRTLQGIELPRAQEGKNNLFELRVYESRSQSAHTKKVAMFDNGEIAIFRRVGIQPVFFGSTVFGTRLPNLAYMVCYPSWEARAEAWSKFGQDPEWKKMSTAPGNTDRELVTRISSQLMTPLSFSQIL